MLTDSDQAHREYVSFPGLTIPVEPFRLLLDLERRGFRIEYDGENVAIQPGSRLSDEDRRAIRGWKPHLIALLTYVPPEPVQ